MRLSDECKLKRNLAGAGLVSDLKDYTSFVKMLLNDGKINNRKVLSEQTFRKLSTPHEPKCIIPCCESRGLGVRVITNETYPHLTVGSFGRSVWFSFFGCSGE